MKIERVVHWKDDLNYVSFEDKGKMAKKKEKEVRLNAEKM